MENRKFESVAISKIVVGSRFRKDMGDLDALAQSIKGHGLLQPILVSRNLELIAGGRRLQACKMLGWAEIPALIVDTQNIIDCEIQENAVRKDFSLSEMVNIKRYLESKEKELAKERMMAGKPLSDSDKGRADDKIAKYFGISRDTLYKAEKIMEATEKDPERYGDLLRMVDQGKISVNRAYRQVAKGTSKHEEPYLTPHIPAPSAANTNRIKQEIDFQFSLPYEHVKQYVEAILILAGPDQKNPSVWFNGKIDTRTRSVTFAMTGPISDRGDDLDEDERIPREEPLFGFSIGYAEEVSLAPAHTLVCGLTRESGKTTAIEGLLARWAAKKILVFVCKNGEDVFQRYRKISPFLRKDSTISQPPKTEFSQKLQLTEGIQVMDLQYLDPEAQATIISSVAEEILDVSQDWHDVILVIPEAWQTLPRDRDSPAKLSVERLMRHGAVKGNFVVLDSQDISGIHVPIRKQIGNWIIGKQNEINEIKRSIEHLPIKIDWDEMKHSLQTLKLGQFYVVTRGKVAKTFAWPVWMHFYDAIDCAAEPDIVYKIMKKK